MKKLVLVLTIATTHPLHAQGETSAMDLPLHARLLFPRCSEQPFDEIDLVSALRVELLSHGTELVTQIPGDAEPGREALLVVDAPSCNGTGIRIRIENVATERSLGRDLDLGDRPLEERGRVLALAIAELLRTRWAELGAPEVVEPAEEELPGFEPEPPVVDEEGIRRSSVRESLRVMGEREERASALFRRARIELALLGRAYPLVQGGLFGGRAGAGFQLSRSVPFRLVIDVEYGNGGGSTSRGDVRVNAAVGGLSLLFAGGSTTVRGTVGPRLELGYGWVKGIPTVEGVESASFGGLVLTIELVGGVRVRLANRVLLLADVTVGYVAVGIEPNVEGRAVAGIGGVALGANAGIAIEI